MFVTFRKYLEGPEKEDLTGALLRVAHLLLVGIASHAVEVSEPEYAQFRADITALDEQLGEQPTAEDSLVIAGAALKTLENYSKRLRTTVKAQEMELHSIVNMLTETVTVLSAGAEAPLTNLQQIQRQLAQASQVEDVRVMKARLRDCLTALESGARRRREESARTLSRLRNEVQNSRHRSSLPGSDGADSTSLPDRVEAESALADAFTSGSNIFLAIFVVQRVPVINVRYGYQVGDQILANFGEHVKGKVLAGDRIYRWQGPCFIALMERATTAYEVQAEVNRIGSSRLEETIQVGGRSVFLPISSTWSVVNINQFSMLNQALQHIAQFIESAR